MTITLNISPEAEAQLYRRASLAGVSLPQLVAEIVERDALPHPLPVVSSVPPTPQTQLSPQQWRSRLEEIAAAAPSSAVLSAEATRRESIYGE